MAESNMDFTSFERNVNDVNELKKKKGENYYRWESTYSGFADTTFSIFPDVFLLPDFKNACVLLQGTNDGFVLFPEKGSHREPYK